MTNHTANFVPRLSERLKLVASFVPQDSRIADIGTDHGFVPICLAKEGRIKSALAMDVRLKPQEADTVIIAGMGGELEIKILQEGRHLWSTIRRFILSPQSDLEKVRRFLSEEGFLIEKEAMLREEGKYYTVMSVVRGAMVYNRTIEYRYGKYLLEQKEPVLKEYLKKEEERVLAILASLSAKEKGELTKGQEKARQSLLEELSQIREAEYEVQ